MRLADLADVHPVGGGEICEAYRARWNGRPVFAKTLRNAPSGFFVAEQRGLNWLRETGAPVPEVLHVDDELLVLEWVDGAAPTRSAAEGFGRDLAAVHATAAPAFGAEWAGFIGSLSMDNARSYRDAQDWPRFFAEQRLLPFLRLAVDRRAIDDDGRRVVEQVCDRLGDLAGPPEPPARIHGDLWSGNVHWGQASDGAGSRVWLIDPAAHGGHRETDLAMLDLFGCPHLDVVLAAYREQFPLVDGWRQRVPLHQLHPLLAHAAMFGRSYGARVTAVARRSLSGA